jgi:hypothetical protein
VLYQGKGWVCRGRWRSGVRRRGCLSLAEAVVDRLSQRASREMLASIGPGKVPVSPLSAEMTVVYCDIIRSGSGTANAKRNLPGFPSAPDIPIIRSRPQGFLTTQRDHSRAARVLRRDI